MYVLDDVEEVVLRTMGVLSDYTDKAFPEDMIITVCRKTSGDTSHSANTPQNLTKSLADLQSEGLVSFTSTGWCLTPLGTDRAKMFDFINLPPEWEGDPYMKALGLDLPCFARGFAESEVCKACPVTRLCIGTLEIRKTVLGVSLARADLLHTEKLAREAARVRQEEEARLKKAMEPTPAADTPEARPIGDLLNQLNKAKSTAAPRGPVPFEDIREVAPHTYCSKCKKTIKGPARFREGEGYYHVACEDK